MGDGGSRNTLDKGTVRSVSWCTMHISYLLLAQQEGVGDLRLQSQVEGEDPPHQEGVGVPLHLSPQGHDVRDDLVQRVLQTSRCQRLPS